MGRSPSFISLSTQFSTTLSFFSQGPFCVEKNSLKLRHLLFPLELKVLPLQLQSLIFLKQTKKQAGG